MEQMSVYGYATRYEDDAYEGIKYLLQDLDRNEAKVFFEQARIFKASQFEDDRENQYTLNYNPDGTYNLIKDTRRY